MDKTGNSYRNVHKGFPQEGVLSPLLFCLYIANIIKNLPKSTFISMHADDVAILVKKKSQKSSISIIEKTINIINNNLRNLGLEFAPHKTVLIHFNDRGIKPNQTKIKIHEPIVIKLSVSVRYLVLTLDYRLTFRQYIELSKNKCMKAMKLLKFMCGTWWVLIHIRYL